MSYEIMIESMKNMKMRIDRMILLSLTILLSIATFNPISAKEPITLIGTIVKWRYPEAEIRHSEMSDAGTKDVKDHRTIPSTLLKTSMVTPDSVEKVVAFYRNLFTHTEANRKQLGLESDAGVSVLFSDESNQRPFALHTILVTAPNISTTIIITRASSEKHTHISWKQYLKHSTQE